MKPHARFVSSPYLVHFRATLEKNERWPKEAFVSTCSEAWIRTYMAETEYLLATSLAASTSHLRKLTVGYCFASNSNVGAIAWHGPHLRAGLSHFLAEYTETRRNIVPCCVEVYDLPNERQLIERIIVASGIFLRKACHPTLRGYHRAEMWR